MSKTKAGIMLARVRLCGRCPHRVDKHASTVGPGEHSRFCTGGDGGLIQLGQEYMEGPDSNCPLGYWADRVRVNADGHAERQCWPHEDAETDDCGPARDSAAFREWNMEQNREHRRQKDKPGIKKTVKQIGDSPEIKADAETALAVLVAAGGVPGWMADKIAQELEKPQRELRGKSV